MCTWRAKAQASAANLQCDTYAIEGLLAQPPLRDKAVILLGCPQTVAGAYNTGIYACKSAVTASPHPSTFLICLHASMQAPSLCDACSSRLSGGSAGPVGKRTWLRPRPAPPRPRPRPAGPVLPKPLRKRLSLLARSISALGTSWLAAARLLTSDPAYVRAPSPAERQISNRCSRRLQSGVV